jgi:hypothetical protein
MALKRTPLWYRQELPAFLAARKAAPFAWGVNDCCMFPADAIQAITSTDIAGDFRGKYTDQASALALIKTVTGGTTVADAAAHCATKAGLVEWKFPLQAQRGDLVVLQDGANLIGAIVSGDGRYAVTAAEGGMKYFPLRQVTRAWKV